MNRRTVIYTSGVLETLYSLKSSDIKSDVYGHEYVSSTALLHGVPYVVGLCDKDYKYHILTSREKMMMDQLQKFLQIWMVIQQLKLQLLQKMVQ